MVAGLLGVQPGGMTIWRNEEDSMALPPRPTEEQAGKWEVTGERPVRGTPPSSDRGMLLLVGIVLVALIVALVVLFAI